MHSVTKYLNGHGDVVGGIVSCRDPAVLAAVRKWRQDTGAIMAPMDAFLVLRGLRTLAMRMERHSANALAAARFLAAHPKVTAVMHPGLESSPGHAVAVRQMCGGFGGTFSFTVAGGFDAAKRVIEHCKLCTLAVSLGTLDSLIEHPASMTHAGVPPAMMAEQGLCPELIRVSAGIEDAQDIIADLEQALTFA
jgi:cystathionine gamma-synthase